MRTEMYEMSDEELELFNKKFIQIGRLLNGMPAHLVAPLLLRLTVGSYLDMKGFEHNKPTVELAQRLVSELTELLVTNTNRYLTERK